MRGWYFGFTLFLISSARSFGVTAFIFTFIQHKTVISICFYFSLDEKFVPINLSMFLLFLDLIWFLIVGFYVNGLLIVLVIFQTSSFHYHQLVLVSIYRLTNFLVFFVIFGRPCLVLLYIKWGWIIFFLDLYNSLKVNVAQEELLLFAMLLNFLQELCDLCHWSGLIPISLPAELAGPRLRVSVYDCLI